MRKTEPLATGADSEDDETLPAEDETLQIQNVVDMVLVKSQEVHGLHEQHVL